MRTIYIIHPARSILHYRVLTSAQDLKLRVIGIPSVNDLFLSLENLQLRRFLNVLSDSACWFFLKFVCLNKDIIFSLEPFNRDILKFKLLIKRHKCIYQTSWPFWTKKNQPIKGTAKIKKSWIDILSKVKIVTVTEQAKKEISKFIKRESSLFIIPHAVNFKLFKNDLKEKIGILFVGRFMPEKNLFFIKALIEKLPDQEFVFVGEGPDLKIISGYSNVKIIPFIREEKKIAQFFKKAKILVLPSKYELFSMVLIEALAARCFVVAAPNVGPNEIIDNELNGYLLPLNVNLWVKKIRSILKNNYQKVLINGEQKVLQRYDYPVVLKKWRKIFDTN